MLDLSVIIPSRECPYAMKTVQDVLDKATLNIEVLVAIDGPVPDKLVTDERVRYFYSNPAKGMRWGINQGIKHAKGKYLMKCDDHCLFDEGFDQKMIDEMQPDWLMVPRRYSLDAENWKRRSYIRDYHYLHYPINSSWGNSMAVMEWRKRNDKLIDDTMIFQGSCWMAERDYFLKHIGSLDEKNYGKFGGEQMEIGLKYWLGGGAIKVNKKTWYAHLHKNKHYYYMNRKYNKGYKKSDDSTKGRTWATHHWMNNEEPGMIHDFKWLIDKFNPPGWEGKI